jgi:H+-translocating NAD(P) transhydrogenase subunit alpha
VALVPEVVNRLVKGAEVSVTVEAGAGEAAHQPDSAYEKAGAALGDGFSGQVVAKVAPPSAEEVGRLGRGTVLIGFLQPLTAHDTVRALADAGVTSFAMEAIPRITRAQSMDALSSQATVGGYRAALIAAEHLPRFFPMLTTAAGTVRPARGIIMGAGVAGLMAIGTARRLGAVVEATDVRPAVKEQVQSLGGTFLEVEMTDEEKAQAETAGGYAREMSEDYKRRQAELISQRISEADFVITTALIPGRPAPRLVTEEHVRSMRAGSVIIDLAAEAGGNCELTEPGKEVIKHGVAIIGLTNLPASMPAHATQMYAKNISTLVKHLIKDGKLELDFDDEITRGATITHQGKVVNEATAQALGVEPSAPQAATTPREQAGEPPTAARDQAAQAPAADDAGREAKR